VKPKSNIFHDYVSEQLAHLSDFHSRRMFGGYGLYSGVQFFGLIYQSRLFFRTGDDTRAAYKAAGMSFFQPNPKQSLKNYYEVPRSVLEETAVLMEWANAAIIDSKTPNNKGCSGGEERASDCTHG
jgi:DNA transformation protein